MTTRTSMPSKTRSSKADRVLSRARDLAAKVGSWADFANALFDPENGFVAQVYPDLNQRQRFFKSKEYAAIDRMLSQLMRRFGVADGATPRDTGRFMVSLPRSLRQKLELEAAREGVNLDQLVLVKLALPLDAPRTSAKSSRGT